MTVPGGRTSSVPWGAVDVALALAGTTMLWLLVCLATLGLLVAFDVKPWRLDTVTLLRLTSGALAVYVAALVTTIRVDVLRIHEKSWEDLGAGRIGRKEIWSVLITAASAAGVCWIAIIPLALDGAANPDGIIVRAADTLRVLGRQAPVDTAILLVTVVCLVPLTIELVMRGLLQRWLVARLGTWPAIILPAAGLALAQADLERGLVAFDIGLACGWATERCRHLLAGYLVASATVLAWGAAWLRVG